MKSFIISAFTILAFFAFTANAAKEKKVYTPTETWPYMLEEFEAGTVKSTTGEVRSYEMLNIYLPNHTLHYVMEDKVLVADMAKVYLVAVGEDVYLNTGGKLRKIMLEGNNGVVLEESWIDMEAYNSVDIGYGISSRTASAQNVSNLYFLNNSAQMNMNLTDLVNKRDSKKLEIRKSLYLRVNGLLYKADINEIAAMMPDSKAAKKELKKLKIKWKDPNSLIAVVDYIYEKTK